MTDPRTPSPYERDDGRWFVAPSTLVLEGEVISRRVRDVPVAVARHRGRLHAFGALCPHQGSDLADGILEPEGTIACAWHLWSFEMSTGRCTMIEGASVPVFEVDEVDGDIVVTLAADDA